MKVAITLVVAALAAAAVTGIALAHTFTASTSITRSKLPEGTTPAGDTIVVWGKVSSRRTNCRANRRVRLLRVRTPGSDVLLDVARTNVLGQYLFVLHPLRDQTVYVKVRARVQTAPGHSHTCFASRSKNLVIDVS